MVEVENYVQKLIKIKSKARFNFGSMLLIINIDNKI